MNPFVSSLIRRSLQKDIVLVDTKSKSDISAKELLDSAYNIAEKLWARGIRKGDYIILSVAASPEYYSILYGCFIIGAIPSLVDISLSKPTLVTCIDELKPSLWISSKEIPNFSTTSLDDLFKTKKEAFPDPELTENSICLLLYTTGTTGVPKGVPWTIRQLESQAHELKRFHDQINTEFVIFPYLALACIYNNRKAVIPHTHTTQPNHLSIVSIINQMKEFGSDYIFASPAFWARTINHFERTKEKLDFIKIISTAGAALSPIMLQKLDDILIEGEIYIPYASTEALLPITLIRYSEFKVLSKDITAQNGGIPIGKACKGIDIEIIPHTSNTSMVEPLPCNTIGEIIVSGSRVTEAYFRRPEITAISKVKVKGHDAIWHKMGDIGYIDKSGMLWFLARKKYVVNSNNGLFFPDSTEQYLNIHGNMLSCAVIYCDESEIVSVIIPEFEREYTDQKNIRLKLNEIGYDQSKILFYPTLLPGDSRHNSKIDRKILKEWVNWTNKSNNIKEPL